VTLPNFDVKNARVFGRSDYVSGGFFWLILIVLDGAASNLNKHVEHVRRHRPRH
jgi:hypothetical protein